MRYLWFTLFLLPLFAKDTCQECHSSLDGKHQAPAAAFTNDIHKHVGLACSSCHGGDPQAEAPEAAMSRAKGFLGKISRTQVPKLCARCHSDADLMHKYKPQQRVDQFAQYMTSVHGKRLTGGDEKVANCVDCHGVHNIREVRDALSPVHPLRLPETCARCHASQSHMAGYKIPTGQFADYRAGVHWEALSKRRDLSAPSCATCHGNHGATPPQVASVAAVCGSCHAMQEDLYRQSPHQPVFAGMGMGGCVACHSNHRVEHPNDGFLAGLKSVCSGCHDAGSAGGKLAVEFHRQLQDLEAALNRSREVVEVARRSGMEVSDSVLRLQEGNESLLKARVAIHSFRRDGVAKPLKEGMTLAAETYRAGQQSLQERDYRRIGLAVSLIAILATIAGLYLTIRRIESGRQTDA